MTPTKAKSAVGRVIKVVAMVYDAFLCSYWTTKRAIVKIIKVDGMVYDVLFLSYWPLQKCG